MKRQLSRPRSWVGDAGEKRSHRMALGRMAVENDELNSTAEEPSTPRRNTTLPRHKSSYLRFLTWIAFYHQPYSNISDNQQQFCPVYECNVPSFQTQGDMLKHVGDCPELQKGTYHCPNCNKYEKISRFHGDSCTQPHNPFQKARNSLRSVKSMFIPHEPKQNHQAVERTVSGPTFPQDLIELDSHSHTPELPSYHPNNFIPEMESPISDGNGWPWSTQKGMDVQSARSEATSGPPWYYSTTHPALRSEAMNQSSYNIQKYAMTLASGSYQNFGAAELSAIPSSGEHSVEVQHSNKCPCSTSQATQDVPSWSPSLPSTQDLSAVPTASNAQDLRVEPTPGLVYGTIHHDHDSQAPHYRPVRPYVSQGSMSSTSSFLNTDGTSRSSTVSSMDFTSSSRNTSFSEQDAARAIPFDNQVSAKICEENDTFFDDPGEMDVLDYFQSPAAALNIFQPLGLRNEFKDPVNWPPEYLATTTTSLEPNTVPSQAPFPSRHPFSPTSVEQFPVALTNASHVSSADSLSLHKPPSPLQRRKRVSAGAPKATASSTSISSSPATSKLKMATKVKEPYECKCSKIMDRTNTARHRKACRARAPAFSERKDFKCPFKNCSSSGFTRRDNLRAHQHKQGHFLQTDYGSHHLAAGDRGGRGTESEMWNGETYIMV